VKLRAISAAILIGAPLLSARAAAQPYRLRADAYLTAAAPTTGLLMLQGEARLPSWVSAETAVWIGTGEYPGDVLVASVRVRDPGGRGELRAGRMLVSTGAIRPVHLDGLEVSGRAPWGTRIEAFGGIPVERAYGPRDFDWAVGQRISQRIGENTTVGVSYLQMRSAGAIAFEELGLDAAAAPARWIDGAFTGAFDLFRLGLTDARLSIALRFGRVRAELFAARRAPSHLLPATSLFAALGDVPSQRIGGSCFVRAAPRLDLTGEGAIESLGGSLGGEMFLRARLRLDDRGNGAVGLEARRQGAPAASWTGLRGTARVPITSLWSAALEVELAAPDEPRGRGAVWPWGLASLRFQPAVQWEVAGAVEAGASPTSIAAVTGIFRISRVLGGR
jgi:hypothetical protein